MQYYCAEAGVKAEEIQTIVILSSWSSGSTAVAGFLAKCGAYSCFPHLITNDSKTPDAYEPLYYRDALTRLVDESTLQTTGQPFEFKAFLISWMVEQKHAAGNCGATHIVLKHPLQAFVLEELARLPKVRFVVVHRPFEEIEKTRCRRYWPPSYGANGAKEIYNTIYSGLQELELDYLSVPYAKFREQRTLRNTLLNYVDLHPNSRLRRSAEEFVR